MQLRGNRHETTRSGNVIGQQGHFPFGESWYAASTTTKYQFTSYERDSESGNDYAQARYHINRLGRFNSPDPVDGSAGNPQSWNNYIYTGNDPLSHTDPTGRDMIEIGGGGLNCTLDGILTSCGSINGNDTDSQKGGGGSGGGGSTTTPSGGPIDLTKEPSGYGFGQIGGVVGMSETYRNQQIGYSAWTYLIPCDQSQAPVICSANPITTDPTAILKNSIAIADSLNAPAISALSNISFVPALNQDPKAADKQVSDYVMAGTTYAKPQPVLNQASPLTDTFACMLEMQNGTSGNYSCRDTKNGATVPISFTPKSITITCIGSAIAGQLPSIITGTGVSADSLKITTCSY